MRTTQNIALGSFILSSQESVCSDEPSNYNRYITESFLNQSFYSETTQELGSQKSSKILLYRQQSNEALSVFDQIQSIQSKISKTISITKPKRFLPQIPEKILDAPELVDDYYLNLLDWGSNNLLAVCLGPSVYLWNAANSQIEQLLSNSDAENTITSVSWIQKGNHLAVGFNDSIIQIWDAQKMAPVRNLKGHTNRVSSLSWNQYILSSGGRDNALIHHDVRVQNSLIHKIEGVHTQEICGLKWSPDGEQLATGSNDNTLMIWDAAHLLAPKFVLRDHRAAVKALAWCPWQSKLIASGGGTNDKCIKLWNTENGALLSSIDTESQVCSLLWNSCEKELVSSHGFSQNQITVRKYPSWEVVGEFKGHESRVLHMAMSPDSSTIVSAAADETLRFWKLNEPGKLGSQKSADKNFLGGLR